VSFIVFAQPLSKMAEATIAKKQQNNICFLNILNNPSGYISIF